MAINMFSRINVRDTRDLIKRKTMPFNEASEHEMGQTEM